MKKVNSMKNVDFSEMVFPIIVVYNSPADYPGWIVARVWEGEIPAPTDTYALFKDLDSCREDMERSGFPIRLPKSEQDDPCILESYIQ